MKQSITLIILWGMFIGCSTNQTRNEFDPEQVLPKEIIDLSPIISEDLPEKKWGKAMLELMGFRGQTEFIHVGIDTPLYVRNSYIEIFNHGGAHLDAPNHMEQHGLSIEEYDLNRLIGPVKILDATSYTNNSEIPVEPLIDLNLTQYDIFMLNVNYVPPQSGTELPSYPYLSKEACQYLASIPVKAVATDALSIESINGFNEGVEAGLSGYENLAPNHYALLTNGIPLFEGLEDISPLQGKENVIFIGFPLKFKEGNGSPIRAVAFVY